MLTQGFAESGITDLDAPFPSTRHSSMDLDDYGYASDSDLEDEADEGSGELEVLMARTSLGSSLPRTASSAGPSR